MYYFQIINTIALMIKFTYLIIIQPFIFDKQVGTLRQDLTNKSKTDYEHASSNVNSYIR